MTYTPIFSQAVQAAARSLGYNLNAGGLQALCTKLDDMQSWRWFSRHSDAPSVEIITRDLREYLQAKPPAPAQLKDHPQEGYGVPKAVFEAMSPAQRLAQYRTHTAKEAAAQPPAEASATDTLKAQIHALHLRSRTARGDAKAQALRDLATAQAALAEATGAK